MLTVFNSRVRYSETTRDGQMSVKALFDYLQDCCTFQSEDAGQGVKVLQQKHRAWLLAAWNIEIVRWPRFGEKINVLTWPYNFRRFFAYRGNAVETEDGELLVKGNSLWVYANTENGHAVTIPKDQTDIYTLEDRLDLPFGSRKVVCKGDSEKRDSFRILGHQIDSNGHTNNSQYVMMAADCIPADFDYSGIRVEYEREAVLGDTVTPVIYPGDDKYAVDLVSDEGRRYAAVEFRKK